MTKEADAFLAHYGVKGMKWGVRRARSDDGSSSPSPRAERRAARKAERQENRANRKEFNSKAEVARRRARARVVEKGITRDPVKIFEAREKLRRAEAKLDIDRAKAYQARSEVGKNASKQMLRKASLDYEISYIMNNQQAAMQTNSEIAAAIVGSVIDVGISSLAKRA